MSSPTLCEGMARDFLQGNFIYTCHREESVDTTRPDMELQQKLADVLADPDQMLKEVGTLQAYAVPSATPSNLGGLRGGPRLADRHAVQAGGTQVPLLSLYPYLKIDQRMHSSIPRLGWTPRRTPPC